jgi:hypothetical protein
MDINKRNFVLVKKCQFPYTYRALAAETHLAEGLTLKLWLTTKVEKSLILLEGIRKLTASDMEEQLIFF